MQPKIQIRIFRSIPLRIREAYEKDFFSAGNILFLVKEPVFTIQRIF